MTESKYDTLVAVLKNKKNIILQGAPGVGKTFAAKRLAYLLIIPKSVHRKANIPRRCRALERQNSITE